MIDYSSGRFFGNPLKELKENFIYAAFFQSMKVSLRLLYGVYLSHIFQTSRQLFKSEVSELHVLKTNSLG